jgi:hypothetical protein
MSRGRPQRLTTPNVKTGEIDPALTRRSAKPPIRAGIRDDQAMTTQATVLTSVGGHDGGKATLTTLASGAV